MDLSWITREKTTKLQGLIFIIVAFSFFILTYTTMTFVIEIDAYWRGDECSTLEEATVFPSHLNEIHDKGDLYYCERHSHMLYKEGTEGNRKPVYDLISNLITLVEALTVGLLAFGVIAPIHEAIRNRRK